MTQPRATFPAKLTTTDKDRKKRATAGIVELYDTPSNIRILFRPDSDTEGSLLPLPGSSTPQVVEIPVSQFLSKKKNGFQISKSRPLLRLNLKNSAQFDFRLGTMSERDELHTQIAELRQLFASWKGLSETERSQIEVVSRNRKLNLLHENLVESGVFSWDDFWSQRRHLYEVSRESQQSGLQLRLLDRMVAQPVEKKTGSDDISSDLGANRNVTTFKMTPPMIHEVLQMHPGVRTAFHELVPTRISKELFFQRFFRSQYFHRQLGASLREGDAEADSEMTPEQKKTATEVAALLDENRKREIQRIDDEIESSDLSAAPSLDLSANETPNPAYGIKNTSWGAAELPKLRQRESDFVAEQNRESHLVITKTGVSEIVPEAPTQSTLSSLAPKSSREYTELVFRDGVESGVVDEEIESDPGLSHLGLGFDRPARDPVDYREAFRRELAGIVRSGGLLSAFNPNSIAIDPVAKDLVRDAKVAREQALKKGVDEEILGSDRQQKKLFRLFDLIQELLKHFWSAHPLLRTRRAMRILSNPLLRKKMLKIVEVLRQKKKELGDISDREPRFLKVIKPVIESINLAILHFEKVEGHRRSPGGERGGGGGVVHDDRSAHSGTFSLDVPLRFDMKMSPVTPLPTSHPPTFPGGASAKRSRTEAFGSDADEAEQLEERRKRARYSQGAPFLQ